MNYSDKQLNIDLIRPEARLLKRVKFPPKRRLMLRDQDASLLKVGSLTAFDCEVYANYFLVAFYNIPTKTYFYVDMREAETLDKNKLLWFLNYFCIVGFNSRNFDIPILIAALNGATCEQLKELANEIIFTDKRFDDRTKFNHIDLIEVAPLLGSLKLYGARLHSPRIQELPYPPDTVLTPEQIEETREYCFNDLDCTALLAKELEPQIVLRERMSNEIRQDLRSKSDAQVAEAVISTELHRITGAWPKSPGIEADTTFNYKVPTFMQFETPLLRRTLETVANAPFLVQANGLIAIPKVIADLNLRIGNCVYRMSVGGLHTSEKTVAYQAGRGRLLIDRDVAGYYPDIIINQGLYPEHLGSSFLQVYKGIRDRRITAKRAGNKADSAALKITVNGTFGKLGNVYSIMYSPHLLMQVTLSGQLCLLMLIEKIELAGIQVISANTDGIIIWPYESQYTHLDAIIKEWERVTGFETEETKYVAIYSRDVNNYIAIKPDGKCKAKGAYAERGSALDSALSKNPESFICLDAVQELIVNGKPIERTIRECKDIRRFVTVRNVKGGAQKAGYYLGRVVRWYYAKGERGEISYVLSGNKVPKSDGARPLMELPAVLPADIDYDRYLQETVEILFDIGYYRRAEQKSLFG